MKIKETIAILALASFGYGCASHHHDHAEYDAEVHPKTYSSTETVTATSDIDATPRRAQATESYHVDPDGRIVSDREDEQLKAGPQTQVDQQLAQRIREVLVEDEAFANDINDVRISVMKGRVTLRGWVDSDEEKQKVESLAREFSGVNYVDNRLQVGDSDDDDLDDDRD